MGGLLHLRGDDETARPQLGIDPQHDADRAHEVVPLLAGVLPAGLDQFGHERILDALETGVVIVAEADHERVGHDAPTLDVDGTLVVHLPQQPATELDRTDVAFERAREHAVDHTL